MEAQSSVDTSRPFRSVKEAVAVFGERFLVGDAGAPKPGPAIPKPIYSACSTPPSFSSSSSHFNQEREDDVMIAMRKLEAELEETKRELRMLKEREADTVSAVASLMARVSEVEAAGATAKRAVPSGEGLWGEEASGSFEYLPSLAAALSMDEKFGGRKRTKALKRKPIVPLIGDMLFRKKDSADLDNSLYSYSVQ